MRELTTAYQTKHAAPDCVRRPRRPEYRRGRGDSIRPRAAVDGGRDTQKALETLTQQGVDAVLVDLRNNTGGAITEAISIAGLFIDGPMALTRNKRGEVETRKDNDDGLAYDGPLAVLVNRRSASGSEIMAMAIQDYRRGVVIGDSQTFGKGSGARRIDVGRYLRRDDENLGLLDVTTGRKKTGARPEGFRAWKR